MDISDTINNPVGMPTKPVNAVSDDFETFLKMLTTQIQNQDPLSPMAADEFASQLASFSRVEQQTKTNQQLALLLGAMSNSNVAAYSTLVGRTAVHEGPFNFSGAPIQLELDTVTADSDTKIAILDDLGVVVAELPMPSGEMKTSWDGTDIEGRPVTPGLYTAEVRRISDDSKLDVSLFTSNVVEEVRFASDGIKLQLADGTLLAESRVSKLR